MNCYCKKCGKLANVDDTVVLTSYPPQFSYSCPHCGDFGYVNCSDAFEKPREESTEEKMLKKLEEISVELNNLRKDVDFVSKYVFGGADAAVNEAQKTIETIKAGHLPPLEDPTSSKVPYGIRQIDDYT